MLTGATYTNAQYLKKARACTSIFAFSFVHTAHPYMCQHFDVCYGANPAPGLAAPDFEGKEE